ncbi:MAG: NADH-quinone oxidoreductase subunit NuoE [Alphaproteobacteria bacterium]|nr:NADH-quinone oxidoreductase subunit NuoE [Alphaproteobacteria bacterium]
MAVRRLHPDQPETFAFNAENLAWANTMITHYPDGQQASAVIPLLWRAQEQHDGWLPEPAIRYIAEMLGMAYIRVYEVATFYTMFQLAPVGKVAHVQVCGTTPCMLRGSEDLIAVCKKKISKSPHDVSADGNFSWEEVECLGVCANAPMVQIWKDTYEDLTPASFEKLLNDFAAGTPPPPGSLSGRQASCPKGGPTSLHDYCVNSDAPPGPANSGADGPSVIEPAVAAAGATGASGVAAEVVEQSAGDIQDADRPKGLDGPRGGQADDLKRINGVGPKLEETLNSLGIFHFDQVAGWSPETVAWVDNFLSFKGRIDREGWIKQAKALAAETKT